MISMFKRLINRLLARFGYMLVKQERADSGVSSDGNKKVYGPVPERLHIITEQLYSRLPQSAINAFWNYVSRDPETYSYLHTAPPEHKTREILRIGNCLLPDIFNPATGLSRFNTPDDVHAMVREEVYCGDLYYCDLISEALHGCGRAMAPGGTYLDFGCSSGRVIRTLSVACPESKFMGCDPNAKTIEWARQAMPSIHFFVSPERPPLNIGDGAIDGAYAISIWSHFSERAAWDWLDEMHRVIRPGGFILFTAHGFGSLEYYTESNLMPQAQKRAAAAAMNRAGHFFVDVFGPQGDWGVGKSDWGQFFVNPAHVIQNLRGKWALLDFVPRRSENNQDVYLLERA
ncbi:MAG: class I SAM-dependent methyltransferase [Burkholderiaceae bacterium]|jgi:SAM-dependent methyltransferase|nr:class I SAM-dependent methyltransferase [Burkholderiaceae bacterium]